MTSGQEVIPPSGPEAALPPEPPSSEQRLVPFWQPESPPPPVYAEGLGASSSPRGRSLFSAVKPGSSR